MNQLKNSVVVPVIDRFGYEIEQQDLRNTPFTELYPNEQIVLIQWTAQNDNSRPSIEELSTPVEFNGRKFYGSYAWGSAVKRGITIGLAHDFPQTDGPVKLVEDGQRVGRWLISQGTFGGFTAQSLEIGIEKPGTLIAAGPIEDGFGYIRRSLVEKYAGKERIELGTSRDNWSFWQRIPWDQVAEELAPMIEEACIDASDPQKMLWQSPHSFDQKKELYDLDKSMIEHPFVAAALNRSSQDYFSRMATSVNLHGEYKTAVPTTAENVCWPGHAGKVTIDRSPIDSNGSLQAIELVQNAAEEERISKLEVIQVSISTKDFSTKGCLGIVEDELLEYDIVICSEDIKMAPDLKTARNAASATLENVVVPFLQIWDSKSLVGVSAFWAKNLMGLDHDGDGVRLVDCASLPRLWQAIRDLPAGETPKLKKSKRPLKDGDYRADMIFKSMVNLVGFATNVAGATFVVSDRDWLAKELGMKSEQALDNRLNYFIKVGTDGFKTDVDQAAVAKEVAVMQNNIVRLFGRTAPWTGWNDDGWAFKRGLPPIILAANNDGSFMIGSEDDPVALENNELKLAVWPFMDGTVAQIARLVIPAIRPHWTETVPLRPLTAFRNWVPEPRQEEYEMAKQIQFWYNARVGRVNWTDTKSILSFKMALKERCEEWGIDRMKAACALWYVAHSSRGGDASAASVFLAFPEECKVIVADKPGEQVKEVVLTGLNYQLPRFTAGVLENLTVADVTVTKQGKRILRRVLVGDVAGQVAPRDLSLPRNLIAFIAANENQPELGTYRARITPIGSASWACCLE
jgi:hypothetical protein